jgi:hypothetical protein
LLLLRRCLSQPRAGRKPWPQAEARATGAADDPASDAAARPCGGDLPAGDAAAGAEAEALLQPIARAVREGRLRRGHAAFELLVALSAAAEQNSADGTPEDGAWLTCAKRCRYSVADA